MTISLRGAPTTMTALGLVVLTLLTVGCDDSSTAVLVENDYPAAAGGAASEPGTTVFRAWWVTTLFPSPVAPGAVSETERTIPATDFAYALLAPGWSPGSATPPTRLVALKSTQKLTASAHQLLTIALSDQSFTGNCAAGSVLDDADAQLIVQSIFPGPFAGLSYDPATCTSVPAMTDAGAD